MVIRLSVRRGSAGAATGRGVAKARRGHRQWPSRSGLRQQASYAHDVVGGRGEGEDPRHEPAATVTQFPQTADSLHPTKRLLDEFSLPLTDGVRAQIAML